LEINLRVTIQTEDAELYGQFCNIFARLLYNIPDEDPFIHTSSEARKLANRIVDILQEYGVEVDD
jgi:hypothetical protein